ncbi:MAG: type II toxin-antitoxin system VapC family toxin [Nitrospirae bacterium]|nr:type II toxin-antitoxin system VapC family toxin [Nitrospirota bacterium]
MRVLDTSVIYKWYVEEEDTANALLLRDDFVKRGVETVIPDLLFHELANALRYNPKLERPLYLALAKNLEFEFITADKKLYEKNKTT